MYKRAISLLLIVAAPTVAAITPSYSNGELSFNKGEQRITLRCAADNAIEVIANSAQPSYSIVQQSCQSQWSKDTPYRFQVGALTAEIDQQNGSLNYYLNGEFLVAESQGLSADQNQFSFTVTQDEVLYGTGERVLGMNRRGNTLPLYNRAHYAYGDHSTQMYYSMPMVLSSKRYAIVYDNPGKGEVDLANKQPNQVSFNTEGGRHAYWITAAPTWSKLNQNLSNVSGYQPLPPRWALGSFASRVVYRNEQQVLDTLARYQQKQVPIDALVLDLYWFGKDIKGHMGNLDWDLDAFPAPKRMISELANNGVKTVLITEPFVLTNSKRWDEAVNAGAITPNSEGQPATYDFYFGNTGLVDVFSSDGKAWFSSIYNELAEYGVAGWWGDLGEPEVHPEELVHAAGTANEIHNAYGHEWANLLYNSLLEMQPNTRPFILMRSGFVGSQRYGMIPWSGDVSRSWEGLAAQPEIMLQMGMQGLAYMHSDLGGFTPADSFDSELYQRWIQFGAFSPVFRPHANDEIPSEPVYHDEQTIEIARNALNERYRLMPYLYSLAHQNSNEGQPLARPMFYYHDDAKWLTVADQYYWGDRFIVAPVLQANIEARPVELPTGGWYDFRSLQKLKGSGVIDYPVNNNSIPVFIKAGSLLVETKPMLNLAAYDLSHIKLRYFAAAGTNEDQLTVFHDDGLSIDGTVERNQFTAVETKQSININAQLNSAVTKIELELIGLNKTPTSVLINGKAQEINIDESGASLHLMINNNKELLQIEVAL